MKMSYNHVIELRTHRNSLKNRSHKKTCTVQWTERTAVPHIKRRRRSWHQTNKCPRKTNLIIKANKRRQIKEREKNGNSATETNNSQRFDESLHAIFCVFLCAFLGISKSMNQY